MLHDSQHRSMFTSIYFQRVHIYSTDFCAIVVPSSVNNINFNCFVVFFFSCDSVYFSSGFPFSYDVALRDVQRSQFDVTICHKQWNRSQQNFSLFSYVVLGFSFRWAWEIHTQIIPIVRIRRHHSYQPMEESCVKEWGERNTKLSFSYSGLNFAVSTPLFHSI